MSESDDSRVRQRAEELNPEELAAGSDDPQRQAEIILEDSDRREQEAERTQHPDDMKDGSTRTPTGNPDAGNPDAGNPDAGSA
ncbi:MAG TPA: hypothetical protein VHO01_04505 [Jatrophihabitans sp.]|nr:hypothetical protein [Jatrophihabitans sp.]